MFKTVQGGFKPMNEALKERVEERSVPDTKLKQRVGSSVKSDVSNV